MANNLLTTNQITAEALNVLEKEIGWGYDKLFERFEIEKYWKRKWGYKYRIRKGGKVVSDSMSKAEAEAMVKLMQATQE
jgi:hypothetical protein